MHGPLVLDSTEPQGFELTLEMKHGNFGPASSVQIVPERARPVGTGFEKVFQQEEMPMAAVEIRAPVNSVPEVTLAMDWMLEQLLQMRMTLRSER